jgi:NDP-sugar pyrophosphorylase family protein
MKHQAVIIAGGQAMRMRPYTDDRPKAMAEIAGEPIISHQLKWLSANHVSQVVILVGYKAELIKTYVGDGGSFGLAVSYANEATPVGRGGALRLAAELLPDKRRGFFALNGDLLAWFNLESLFLQHKATRKLATIALARYRTTMGVAYTDGSTITAFEQSPLLPYWVNVGAYYFETRAANLLPVNGDHEEVTFPHLAQHGQLGAYKINEYWLGIDTVSDIIAATAEVEARLKTEPRRRLV